MDKNGDDRPKMGQSDRNFQLRNQAPEVTYLESKEGEGERES